MTQPYVCDLCDQPIEGSDYFCAGMDRGTWRTLLVHPGCFRPDELKAKHPGAIIVEPTKQVMKDA